MLMSQRCRLLVWCVLLCRSLPSATRIAASRLPLRSVAARGLAAPGLDKRYLSWARGAALGSAKKQRSVSSNDLRTRFPKGGLWGDRDDGEDDPEGPPQQRRVVGESVVEMAAAKRIAETLTREERKLFAMLLGAARKDGRKTTLRVAGGWVRDKLLGASEDKKKKKKKLADVDIALDNQLGSEFAQSLAQFLEDQPDSPSVPAVALIASNPGKSKHLETATMSFKRLGVQLDLVNLRAETYADAAGRVPSGMRLGTPLEDARRRDLTINALFYNLANGRVEDWTGEGLRDIEHKIVRTPLPSRTTLLDDPLRCLRAVRFTARLGFALDEELRQSAASEEVRLALASKVSRERVGAEFDLMLRIRAAKGEEAAWRPLAAQMTRHSMERELVGPDTAMRLLLELGLMPHLLLLDTMEVDEDPKKWRRAVQVAIELTDLLDGDGASFLDNVKGDDDEVLEDEGHRRLAFYAALIKPLEGAKASQPNKKKGTQPAARTALGEGLKMKHKDVDEILQIRQAADSFADFFAEGTVARLDAGKSMIAAAELWEAGFYVALAEGLASGAGRQDVQTRFAALRRRLVDDLDLVGVWQMKPLLDGNAIMTLLDISGGTRLAELLAAQEHWQLQNPRGTEEQARRHLAQRHAEMLASNLQVGPITQKNLK